MEQLIRKQELLTVWHAFSKKEGIEGWQSIRMGHVEKVEVVAGCRFPEKEEFVAFGFMNYKFPSNYKYPQCKGFYVLQNNNIFGKSDFCWLIIIKKQPAGIDLFVTMIEDLFNTVKRMSFGNEQFIFKSIISRIRLWQRFLGKTVIPVLNPEKELGLFGELSFLTALLKYLEYEDVIESWKGPLDEPKDFILGDGGVEVKSTTSIKQFRAKISSLEQLDTSIINPLFLIGFRFKLGAEGETLVSLINKIRDILKEDEDFLVKFESLLINYGYIDLYSSEYTNVYSLDERFVFRVINDFPRITEENTLDGILEAKYEIDLANLPQEDLDDKQILKQLGVLL